MEIVKRELYENFQDNLQDIIFLSVPTLIKVFLDTSCVPILKSFSVGGITNSMFIPVTNPLNLPAYFHPKLSNLHEPIFHSSSFSSSESLLSSHSPTSRIFHSLEELEIMCSVPESCKTNIMPVRLLRKALDVIYIDLHMI
jgi:hypothetical protein